MEIKDKKTLNFFIKADRMINRGYFNLSLRNRLSHLIYPDYIMQYLKSMRWCAYTPNYKYIIPPHIFLMKLYHKIRFKKLGYKLGFTIGAKSCGYGLSLPHYGTIVVGNSNSIGNYAKLHVSTCIVSNGSHIGDNFYIGTGGIISKKITLGDNVTIAANSLVRSSFESNLLLAGNPAIIKKTKKPWFTNIKNRVDKIEQLRKEYL